MFDLDFQSQPSRSVIDFGFSEILDLENVRIDTKVKSASCIQPELMKVIQWMCVTLNSKVNRQGHGIVFNIFDILDLENVRIDTNINFVSCLQPEIWKVMQKGVWPWFSRSCNKDRIFSLSPLDFLTPKTYHINIKYFYNYNTLPATQSIVRIPGLIEFYHMIRRL